MKKLEEDLKKIKEFVNSDFDINNETEIKAIKESLNLEEIEILEEMIKEYKKAYKKALNKQKRLEAQREAQKNYKNIQTNLKIEEYEIFLKDANSKNLNMSQYVKNALESFLKQKKELSNDLPSKNDLIALKAKYDTLESELKAKNDLISELNSKISKNQEKFNIEIEQMKEIHENFKTHNVILREEVKELKIENEKLSKFQEQENSKLRNFFLTTLFIVFLAGISLISGVGYAIYHYFF